MTITNLNNEDPTNEMSVDTTPDVEMDIDELGSLMETYEATYPQSHTNIVTNEIGDEWQIVLSEEIYTMVSKLAEEAFDVDSDYIGNVLSNKQLSDVDKKLSHWIEYRVSSIISELAADRLYFKKHKPLRDKELAGLVKGFQKTCPQSFNDFVFHDNTDGYSFQSYKSALKSYLLEGANLEYERSEMKVDGIVFTNEEFDIEVSQWVQTRFEAIHKALDKMRKDKIEFETGKETVEVSITAFQSDLFDEDEGPREPPTARQIEEWKEIGCESVIDGFFADFSEVGDDIILNKSNYDWKRKYRMELEDATMRGVRSMYGESTGELREAYLKPEKDEYEQGVTENVDMLRSHLIETLEGLRRAHAETKSSSESLSSDVIEDYFCRIFEALVPYRSMDEEGFINVVSKICDVDNFISQKTYKIPSFIGTHLHIRRGLYKFSRQWHVIKDFQIAHPEIVEAYSKQPDNYEYTDIVINFGLRQPKDQSKFLLDYLTRLSFKQF